MKKKNKKKMVRGRRSLRYLPLRTIEFEDQTKEFEQWLRVFGYANSTIYYSPAYLRSFFYFPEACKVLSISNITNNHVKRYIQVISSKVSRRTDRLLSQNYILNHINSIKLFSKYLIESKGILFDASYRFCRGLNESKTWLVRKEIEGLYKACYPGVEGDLNRAILAVYYGLGLRRMEGVGIDFEDIQWNNGMVYVKHAKLKSERYVPMNQKVKQYLEDYETRFRNPLLKKFGRVKESALLISQKGKRISGNAVYSKLQLLAKKANLPQPLSLHTLRHSIATHLLENGLEMESISLFLGHKSLESTQIYTHLIHKV